MIRIATINSDRYKSVKCSNASYMALLSIIFLYYNVLTCFYIHYLLGLTMLKNIIILIVIIIGGYMVYTNYMQNEEIAALDGVVNEEHPGELNPEDVVSN